MVLCASAAAGGAGSPAAAFARSLLAVASEGRGVKT